MQKAIKSALKKAVEDIVRAEFAGNAIDAVLIRDDVDEDGDPIMWVTVIFDSKDRLDVHKRANLIGRLRPEFEARGEGIFPVISYRSKRDHERLGAAA